MEDDEQAKRFEGHPQKYKEFLDNKIRGDLDKFEA